MPNSEVFEPLFQKETCLIERIISTGQVTPANQWYDQDRDEWVILLQGEARLAYEDGTEVNLGLGDYLLIPAHCKHRVTYTSTEPPCVWLAVHVQG
ncbi:MAG TPA: cupin domain-containing protein [Leptolyngbyaceae cyanobacterium]